EERRDLVRRDVAFPYALAAAQQLEEVGLQLRGGDLPEQVVLVVGRRDGEVDLGGPVWRVPTVGPRQRLEALDEIPPEAVQILVGISIQLALERRHHRHPARKVKMLGPPPLVERPGGSLGLVWRHAG